MAGTVVQAATKLAPMKVRCATYNLLAEYFCDPTYFQQCDPAHLRYRSRLPRTMQILDEEIQAGSILCLQELSSAWKRDLTGFFVTQNRNYALHSTNMGAMHVGIAYPAHKYQVIDQTVVSVKSLYPYPNRDPGLVATMKQQLSASGFSLRNEEELNVKNLTLTRPNMMTCLRFKCRSSNVEFVVGTYHMPCFYLLPSIMVAHAALSASYIHEWSKGMPYIYCGDFNSTPGAASYRLLTEGSLPYDHPDFPRFGDGWLPSVTPLRSVYEVKNGREPEFTNYAKVKSNPLFIDTIDYIFVSKEWSVDTVKALPTIQGTKGPFPNESEPSDHILLASSLSLS